MRLYIDECLPHTLIELLQPYGHDANHPLRHGASGYGDHTVLQYCIEQTRVIVTNNARDFLGLLETEELHPGLITLPDTAKARSLQFILAADLYLT